MLTNFAKSAQKAHKARKNKVCHLMADLVFYFFRQSLTGEEKLLSGATARNVSRLESGNYNPSLDYLF